MPISVSGVGQGEAAQVDAGRLAGDDVGHRPGRAHRHGPADVAVADVQEQVALRRPPEHRRALRRPRPPAGPAGRLFVGSVLRAPPPDLVGSLGDLPPPLGWVPASGNSRRIVLVMWAKSRSLWERSKPAKSAVAVTRMRLPSRDQAIRYFASTPGRLGAPL